MIYKIRKYIILIQLIILLCTTPIYRIKAEDRADFKHEDYSEENGRINIRTTSFLFERDLIPKLTVKGAYVYDGVSGATPTGAPPLPNESKVATTEIKDIRRAGLIAADYQINNHKLSPQLAYSSESDYKSFGLSMIDSIDFNDKNVENIEIDDLMVCIAHKGQTLSKDPFYEYKKESFNYFDEMLSNQNQRVLKTLFEIELINDNQKIDNNVKKRKPNMIISKKIGRNDMCPCGSGKKYKVCHGS